MLNEKKQYPRELKNEVEQTLEHYTDLSDLKIVFKWGKFTQHSFMLAQPIFATLLGSKACRAYQIIMKKDFFLKNKQFSNGRVPSDVIVGWLGHEMGHIVDYRNRSSLNLVFFGVKYFISKSFLKKAEITADKNAVQHGLIAELVVSKRFGRNLKYFPESYVNKLEGLYPSIADVEAWASISAKKNQLES